MQAFRIMELELIQPDNVHINFENQERKYDVKVGILSTEFRNMIVRLAAIGDIGIDCASLFDFPIRLRNGTIPISLFDFLKWR